MQALTTTFFSIMMLAICLVPLSAEIAPKAAPTIAGGDSGIRAERVESASIAAEGASRVSDLSISVNGSTLTLNWLEVPGAAAYKVFSSASPESGFSEDISGSFAGTTWSTTVTNPRRFYYVTSVTSGVPAGFVFVPGGTFTMGDTIDDEVGDDGELPVHSVTLDPFYIGKYEVTQAEYVQYMQPSSSWTSSYGLGDNYPAYFVSWYASLKYCNLRSLAEGLTPVYSISGSTNPANWGTVPTSYNANWNAAICNWNATGYRLPTEAEWEYAARGAVDPPDYLYSGSGDISAVAWHGGNNSPYGSKPVGTKSPNELGTYDMSGNLEEWCWDWYDWNYYSSSPQNNPTGPASGSNRVKRGGYWGGNASGCRVANRYSAYPYHGYSGYGFRVCRAVP